MFINLSYNQGIHWQWLDIVHADETAKNIYNIIPIIPQILLGRYSTWQLILKHLNSMNQDKKTWDIKILTPDVMHRAYIYCRGELVVTSNSQLRSKQPWGWFGTGLKGHVLPLVVRWASKAQSSIGKLGNQPEDWVVHK